MGARKLAPALALVGALVGLALPAISIGNPMIVAACHGPSGEPVGHDGWVNERTADGDMYATDSCGARGSGSLGLELAPNGGGYPDQAQTDWLFQAPVWGKIVAYQVELGDSYALPWTGAGEGQVFVTGSDETDPIYDYRNLAFGALGASTITRTPPAPDSSVMINVSCDGLDGRCADNVRVARVDLSAAQITLEDPTSPTVDSASGSLLASAPLRGAANVYVQAADEGPGVYSAWLRVDGTPTTPVIFDSNGGWCQSLATSATGTRIFAHPEPCPRRASGTLTLDTAQFSDGQHTVRVLVDDASGNTSTALETTITTDNAPVETAGPTVTGDAGSSPGVTLTAQPGIWDAPSGAGPITLGYRWQRCDTSGGACDDIPGAHSESYVVSSADVGHELRVVIDASDADGLTGAVSAATATVGPPAGWQGAPNGLGASDAAHLTLNRAKALSRPFSASSLRLRGLLRSASGEPIVGARLDVLEQAVGGSAAAIGHLSTDASGAFALRVPPGPSRTVTIAYRSFALDTGYAAAASIAERVGGGVAFQVSPQRTARYRTNTLKGRVLAAVTRARMIVELLDLYRGRMEPFRTPRTDAHGRFQVRYHSEGAIGSFPFRARVRGGQLGFPYAAGVSQTRSVRTG